MEGFPKDIAEKEGTQMMKYCYLEKLPKKH